ncbi:MAG: hypothetical protein ABFS56_29695 [Pseudomonadota bacterium]
MKKILLIIALSSLNCFASAEDIDLTAGIVQDEFKDFVKEFGTVLLFNPMAPAERLGIIGFDISLDAVVTDISDDDAYWTKFLGGSDPDSYIPTLRFNAIKLRIKPYM